MGTRLEALQMPHVLHILARGVTRGYRSTNDGRSEFSIARTLQRSRGTSSVTSVRYLNRIIHSLGQLGKPQPFSRSQALRVSWRSPPAFTHNYRAHPFQAHGR
ncbi:unnamed protein product [Ectocarpus sp. 13 AM-2016]